MEPAQRFQSNQRGKKTEGARKKGTKAEEKALPEGAATEVPRSRAAPKRAADRGLGAMT